MSSSVHQREIPLQVGPDSLCRAWRKAAEGAALLDGRGPFDEPWLAGPLVAWQPHPWAPTGEDPSRTGAWLGALERCLRERRAVGGSRETGLLVLLGYEFLSQETSGDPGSGQRAAVMAVDRSVRQVAPGRGLLTLRAFGDSDGEAARNVDRFRRAIDAVRQPSPPGPVHARAATARTSLPRGRYLDAVRRIQRHIGLGDIYQANLCQRFETSFAGDPFELYVELVSSSPAPCSAYVEGPGWCVASASPETFLRQDPHGSIETRPIKGTRRRGATRAEDQLLARELVGSDKDRAELTMIVDLERNDLSRVCVAGTVHALELGALRSYATVHHLVARVAGRLRPGVGIPDLVRASFPGGSITGAPKLRAIEILRGIEPCPRGWFTGSLLWFADDGSLDSSILIRSLVFEQGRAFLGAGGGIVADSDPEQEWLESNHKARPLARLLGFDPTEPS